MGGKPPEGVMCRSCGQTVRVDPRSRLSSILGKGRRLLAPHEGNGSDACKYAVAPNAKDAGKRYPSLEDRVVSMLPASLRRLLGVD